MQYSAQGRELSFHSLSVVSPDSSSLPPTPRKRLPLCSLERAMTAFKGIWTQSFWRAVSAEFLATLIFVLLGIGSTISWGGVSGSVDTLLISLCFGFSIATMVQCFAHISGGHINPVVTVAMVSTRKLSLAKGFFYILAQCLGAIAGAGILYVVTPPGVRGEFGVTTINYTGASMNPARSFGPAVITGKWENQWVYWVGPTIGGISAAAVYEYLFHPDEELKRRFKDIFKSTPAPGAKYLDVLESRSQAIDYEDLAIKPGGSQFEGEGKSKEKEDKAEERLTPV
ncbi:aquaporin-4 isoform X2 [Hemitrygon akajei]|uniref:aquaporin-4 isoform X2 n=1 Tax=Hemitrygon akajei TaxID=2704970 RepID=UPI003BF95DBA